MRTRIAILMLVALAAQAIDLRSTFNHATQTYTFSYDAKSNHVYTIVRWDPVAEYYDAAHFNESRTNGVVTVVVDPKAHGGTNENLNPTPSNVQIFYLVDMDMGGSR